MSPGCAGFRVKEWFSCEHPSWPWGSVHVAWLAGQGRVCPPCPQPLLSAAFLCPFISGLCYSHPCSSRLCHLALARGLV